MKNGGDWFETEGDIRRFLRAAWPHSIFVEPEIGSTNGAPDVLLYGKPLPAVWFLELKLGHLDKAGALRYEVRPAQRRVLGDLAREGQRVAILAGLASTPRAYLLPVKGLQGKAVLDGRVQLGNGAGLGRGQGQGQLGNGPWTLVDARAGVKGFQKLMRELNGV